MGPYCRFCDQRCFVPIPAETPEHILQAYGGAGSMLVATCRRGQDFERKKTGYCLDMIRSAIPDIPKGDTMMMTERPTCVSCPFWAENEGSMLGECRRQPPTMPYAEAAENTDGIWPVTLETEWCGEHPDMPAWIEQRRETAP
jgi:hypothetical protein